MPTVPRMTRQVAPAPLRPVAAPAAAFGVPATIDLSGPTALLQQARDHGDGVAANAGELELSNEKLRLMTQATSASGLDAFKAATDAQEEWRQKSDAIINGAPERVKDVLRQRANGDWAHLLQVTESHAAAEHKKADKATTDALLSNNTKAVDTDPTLGPVYADVNAGKIAEYGKRNGWSPEQTAAAQSKSVSDVHRTAIARLLSTDQFEQAAKYFDEHGSALLADDRDTIETAVQKGKAMQAGESQADAILNGGQVERGNIDLTKRPRVSNADGSVSTVKSFSANIDGKEVLLPMVADDGMVLTQEQAIESYKKTGKHLGKFATPDAATAYAKRLHDAQEQMIRGTGDGTVPRHEPTFSEAVAAAESITDHAQRDIALRAIDRHFTLRAKAENQDRDAARARVLQKMEKSGGRLNEADPDYQLIAGHPEGQQVLAERRRLTKPPSRVTDMGTFTSLKTRIAFGDGEKVLEQIQQGQYRDKLSDADEKHLVNSAASGVKSDDRRDESRAYGDSVRTARLKDTEDKKKATQAAHDQMIRDLMSGKKPSIPGSPLTKPSPLPAAAAKPKRTSYVPQSWIDHANANDPDYADYLYQMGVDLS